MWRNLSGDKIACDKWGGKRNGMHGLLSLLYQTPGIKR